MHALVFLLLCPAAPLDAKGEDVPKELAKFQGIWKPTAVESRGRVLALEGFRTTDPYTLVIMGNSYGMGTHGGTLKLDTGKQMAELTIKDGRYKGAVLPALYELKEDTLRLAMTSPAFPGARPTELKSTRENGVMLYTFARDTKATKEAVADRLKELKSTLASQAAARPGFPTNSSPTQDMLKQIIERLDRIEKRLDAMEKKGALPEKK